MSEYIEEANENVLAIVTIEHPDAVLHIHGIMSTGVDLAFIGPADLAMLLGIPGQFDHPTCKSVIADAESATLETKVPLGGVARSPEQAREMLARGYRAIVFGFDYLLLQQGIARFFQEVRR